MIIKEYQPIGFTEDVGLCSCNSNTSQLVQDGDITQFQTKMEVCPFVIDLITNGNFDKAIGIGWNNLTSGWAISGSSISSTSTEIEGILESDNFLMGIDVAYQIEVDILDNFGSPLLIYFGTRKIAEITTSGKFQIAGVCDLTGTDTAGKLRIISPVGNTATLERVALYPLESDIGLVVYQLASDGTLTPLVFRSLRDDIDDANFTFFRVNRNTVTVSFDWSYIGSVNGLNISDPYQCFAIGICGKCQNTNGQLGVFDPEMVMPVNHGAKIALDDDTFPWRCNTINSVQILANSGIMKYYLLGGAQVSVTQAEPIIPKIGMDYEFSVKVDSITNLIGKITVNFGGDQKIIQTAGTQTFKLTAINNNSLEILLEDPSSNDIDIDWFRLQVADTSNLLLLDSDFTSNMFNFEAEHDCTLLIAGANNEDAYGLNFESAFYTPKARLKGTLRAMNFDTSVESHINGFKKKEIDYATQRKTEGLRVQDVPEYMVIWLSLFRLFNNVYVDGVEYVAEQDPEPTWNRFCDTAKVEIELGETRQDVVNENTKGLLAVSDINNILVREFDEEETIILIDGSEIELKG